MGAEVTFYIVRHGKTMINTLNRVQGWCDSPLTKEGRRVAEDLGIGLRDIVFDSAYTSDLRRTRETLNIILDFQGQTDLPSAEFEDLREACFGSYEADHNFRLWREAGISLGYRNEQELIDAIFNPEIETTYEHVLDAVKKLDTSGMAENFKEIETRTHRILREIAETEAKKEGQVNVLLVAHGMCIGVMLLNLGGRELFKGTLDNASVSKIIYKDDQFSVESMGDMSYVKEGELRRGRGEI